MTPKTTDDTTDETTTEPALYHDYVCPTHGTIETWQPGDAEGDTVPTDLRCAKTSGEGDSLQVCGQVAVWRTRKGEMPSVAHPSGGEAPGVVPPPA